jgi:hypothetical protein
MKINLYYWNNGVGVVNHSKLIKTLLYEYDSAKVIYDSNQILKDESNRPWKLENMEKIISKIKTI